MAEGEKAKGYQLGTGFIHATVSFDGIGKQIAQEMRKAQKPAQEGGKDTGEKFEGGFRKGISGISERIREAVVSPTAVAAAAAGGAAAGAAWSQGFKRALDTNSLSKSMGGFFAGLSGGRVVKDLATGFRDFARNLDRTVPKIGLVSAGLMSFAGAGIAGVGGILGVTQALGSIAAVALTLPGLLGAAAAGATIFTLAMVDAATVLEDLGPAFVALQDQVSANFWAEAAQPIRDLANNLLPLLATKAGESATAMGSFFGAVANEFNNAGPLELLSQMFDYLRDSIYVAHDAIAPLVSAVMNLGQVGASYLPNLAGWFVDISNALNDWILASIASGDIFDWIDTGLVNLKALGGVLVSTVGIFHALGQAATDAGAGGLVGLAEGLERANRALHTEGAQSSLVATFQAADQAMQNLGAGLGNFISGVASAGDVLRAGMVSSGAALGSLFTLLGDLFAHPAVQGGLASFFGGVLSGAQALESTAGPLGSILGQLLDTMGTMASTIGNVVSGAIAAVSPALVSLLDGIRPLIPALGEIVGGIIDGLAPVLTTVANVVQNVLLPPLSSLFGWLADNRDVITGVVTVLGTMAAVVGTAKVAVLAFKGVLAALKGVMVAVNFVMGLNPFVLVAAAIAGLVVAVVLAYNKIGWFKDFVDAVWAGIKTAFQATISWITETAFPWLMAGIQRMGDKFVWLNTNIIQPVWNWIKGAVSNVVDWFSGTAVPAFQAAIGWLGDVFNFLYRNFVGPAMFFIRMAIEKVATWFSGTVVPAFDSAMAVLGGIFRALYNTFVRPVMDAVRVAVAAVVAWFSGTVVPAFRTAVTAIGNVFRWFRDSVVVPVWNGVRGVINSVTAWFRDVLVPVFRTAIQRVVDKFNAFRTGVRIIWDAVKSLLSAGWNWIDRNVLQKFRDGLTVLEQTFANVRKGIEKSWDLLKAAVKAPITFVVNKVVNPFINGYNAINDAWSGDDIATIPGFRKGGYTGNRGKDDVAGVVHGREYVMPAEQTAEINRTNPGLLDGMRRFGSAALFGHGGHAAHDGMAAGGPGGPGTYLWGGLQNSIYASGVAHVKGSAPGYDIAAATRAWNNMSNLRVRYGSGPNQITVGSGAPAGTWGYAWSDGRIQLNPGIPSGMKTGTAAHEIGHVLGLGHAGTNSIMHPMMQGPLWPSAFDRATIQRIYGGSGKGNPPEGGGGGLFDALKDKILGPLSQVASLFSGNVFGQMASGLARNAVDNIWDAPVGTVHKLTPGVSSIYNGTGSDEYFQRVQPGAGSGGAVELSATDRALLQEIAERVDMKIDGRSLVQANRTAEARFARR